MTFLFQNITFSTSRNVVSMNGQLEAKEKIRGPIIVEIQAKVCDSHKREQCVQVPVFTLDNLCLGLSNTYFFGNLIKAISPKMVCPISQGQYLVKNMRIDMRNVLSISPLKSDTRCEQSLRFFVRHNRRQKREIACFLCSAEVTREKKAAGRKN